MSLQDTWKRNQMVVVDLETTGTLPNYHEIIQIAVVPLTPDLVPCKTHKPFYIDMAPEHPDRQEAIARKKTKLNAEELATTGISQERAADLFEDWVTKLDLPAGKRLIPLAHNWAFEKSFLVPWLGLERFNSLWYIHPRDTMLLAAGLNDMAAWNAQDIPFPRLALKAMCDISGIDIINAHNALSDALATAKLYRWMLGQFA